MLNQNPAQVQVQVDCTSFMEKLAPEMLMKILAYLNVKSLVDSRLVSRRWNEIAGEVVKSRDDVETVFYCRTWFVGQTQRARLKNFIEYFEGCEEESPLCTSFLFTDVEPWVFDHADWRKFLSVFGAGVKSLRLKIRGDFNDKLMEKLRHLLLNQLPNLQEFGFYIISYDASLGLKLFPTTTNLVQLPHLKVVYLEEDLFSNSTGIVTDLLRAAVNLQKIQPFNKNYCYTNIQTFQLLHSLGKLECLPTACIKLGDDLMSQIKGNPSIPRGFKLKELKLRQYKIQNTECSKAVVFISKLFKSSKDTLTQLTVDPFEFLPKLLLPKFRKLTTLTIVGGVFAEKIQVLPPGTSKKLGETFPVLQHLKLGVPWRDFSPDKNQNQDENVSGLQSLKRLEITGREMAEEAVVWISQACPNLKELQICNEDFRGAIKNFPEVGEAVWTRLTRLESLDLVIDLDSRANQFPAVDSTFTGFSGEKCIRLYKEFMRVENQKSGEAPLSQSKAKSGLKLQVERTNPTPTISNLKSLKQLTVHVVSGECSSGKGQKKSDPVLYNKTLVISQNYRFNLMDGLSYKITKSNR